VLWRELEIFKKVWRVSHASGCMVVDADGKRVRVEEERCRLGCAVMTLEGPEVERRDTCAATESAREGFHATTNLEGGHGEWKEVSSHLVRSCAVSLRNNSHFWFLVPLDFLARYEAVTMSVGEPGVLPEECLVEGSVLGGSLVGERGDDVGERVNK
jgi:hypothetical protein